jgi:two-component system, OmpR family, sensor kinase
MAENTTSKQPDTTNEFLRELEIGFVVHELKDPFAVIETGLRALLERKDTYGPLTERQEKTLRRLLRSTLRGRSMVDDLMEIGRAEAGHWVGDAFQPARVVHQTLLDALETVESDALEGIEACATDDEVQSLLAQRGIVLEIDTERESIEILQDEKKFRQILGNLIKNALRFRKQRLHIRFFSNGHELIVEVADDGPGIAREHHELIFEPYTQVGAGASVGRKGHGLGLAGAQTLARRIGGEITLSSEAGEGSVFKLTVPVRHRQEREI